MHNEKGVLRTARYKEIVSSIPIWCFIKSCIKSGEMCIHMLILPFHLLLPAPSCLAHSGVIVLANMSSVNFRVDGQDFQTGAFSLTPWSLHRSNCIAIGAMCLEIRRSFPLPGPERYCVVRRLLCKVSSLPSRSFPLILPSQIYSSNKQPPAHAS